MFGKILVVCMGNICRSPVAAFLLRQQLGGGCVVSSAGLTAVVGDDMDPTSRAVALDRGLDCPVHCARQLTSDMCRDADLILVMEGYQREAVSAMSPVCRGKIFLLGRFLDDMEIPDPYRRGRDVFEDVHGRLARATESWAQRLAIKTF